MKKTIIIYNVIVISICLILNTIAIFEEGAQLKFLILTEILLASGLYYGIRTALTPDFHIGNFFLFIFNLLQTLTLGLFGLMYKVSYGPQIFINLYKETDWFFDLDFSFYSRIFYLNISPPDDYFFIGINLIQLFFAVYFYKELKRISGYILPKLTKAKSKK